MIKSQYRAPKPIVTAPCCGGCEWDLPPSADVVIKAGYRVAWGDFSIVFDGSDTGKPFHEKPWRVEEESAVGTFRPATMYLAVRRFRRYRDAIKFAKMKCVARRRRLR